jgi:uncharacterized protein involved in copper resistance
MALNFKLKTAEKVQINLLLTQRLAVAPLLEAYSTKDRSRLWEVGSNTISKKCLIRINPMVTIGLTI